MNQKGPSYIAKGLDGGPYFFRSTIPKHLRPDLKNKSEIRISLQTGLYAEALKRTHYSQLYAEGVYLYIIVSYPIGDSPPVLKQGG